MNFLPMFKTKKRFFPLYFFIGSSFYLSSCATYEAQYGKNVKNKTEEIINGKIIQSFYLVGDGGDLDLPVNHKNVDRKSVV